MSQFTMESIHQRNAEGSAWGNSTHRRVVLYAYDHGLDDKAEKVSALLAENKIDPYTPPEDLPPEIRAEIFKITGWSY